MNHALVQLMSVLVLLSVINLSGMLAVAEVRQFAIMMPLPVQFIICLVLADFTQYWVHRAFHRIPVLWRFHRVHHSVRSMDWLARSRLHLVDVIVTRGLVLLPLVLLGFDKRAVFAYLGFVSVHAVFIHANFAPRLAWLERLIVMPRFHHWHHAREQKAIDKNFTVHLPLLDRLFGTKYLPDDQWPSGYGIAGPRAGRLSETAGVAV
ncbi:sterol desaturase family protein [Altererythrobacter aquiaggeris]|uniref:sterol desaturase family protein n=1 Tax=Aestuarierythrobacter aquiaggeris TaxID=1898396 RepID=UPI003015B3CB